MNHTEPVANMPLAALISEFETICALMENENRDYTDDGTNLAARLDAMVDEIAPRPAQSLEDIFIKTRWMRWMAEQQMDARAAVDCLPCLEADLERMVTRAA